MKFIPLHVNSGYSILKSGIKINDYILLATKLSYDTVGMMDINSFCGLPKFNDLAKKNNLKPIFGLDLNIESYNFSFIILNETGYRNLCALFARIQSEKISLEVAKAYFSGCFVIFDSKNNIFDIVNDETIKTLAKIAKGIEKFVIGLDITRLDKMNMIRQFTEDYAYDLIAFPHIKYLKKNDAIVIKMLEAIENKEKLDFKTYEGEQYLKSESEYLAIYKKEEIALIHSLIKEIDFNFASPRGKMSIFHNDEGLSSEQYLRKLCYENLIKKGLDSDVYKARLEKELNVISKMGYCDYFLLVQDFINFAQSKQIVVGPGRGSAVGSLVAYCLNITKIDPIKYNLIFERFLNEQRQSMPDIDIDIEDARRNEVVSYIEEKYGLNNVAKIIAIQRFGAKQSLKDVGRIFGYEERHIELFSSIITKNDYDKLSLKEIYKKDESFRKLVDDDKYYLEIVSLASKLDGLPRQYGLHAAGIVINNEPLNNVAPLLLYPADNKYIIQFEKEYIEQQNLLKIDILSIANLSIVKNCLALVKQNKNIDLTLDQIPYDDKNAINLIAKNKTMGLFQLESVGMRKTISFIKPTSFIDVATIIALYRPGPMDNIVAFAKRKNNKMVATYSSAELNNILKETYGTIVYQEQIMQIANKIASFDFAHADLLRSAISKKKADKLVSYRKDFIDGAIKNGYSQDFAEKLFTKIEKFGDYGFNKSHAIGYASLTCKMAYLKYYYPLEFYCSVLSYSDSVHYLETIGEIKESNISIKGPNINKSTFNYSIDNNSIICPLTMIQGISTMLTKSIILERNNGPFLDFYDVVLRLSKYRINSKELSALIDSGSLDILCPSRATMRKNLANALNFASVSSDNMGGFIKLEKPIMIQAQDDLLFNFNKEIDVLKSSFSISPLSICNSRYNIKFTNLLNIKNTNNTIFVPCLLRSMKTITTKNGSSMAFINVFDDSTEQEFALFSEPYKLSINALKKNTIIIIKGRYRSLKNDFYIEKIFELGDKLDG
ncbi:MAG: DNA polymerase III subunit alpha [Erysipelotrichaceae bacterium]|nr:DNA polymerase III subunit alpha [Erysipelotrichaceae bacterium]